MISSIKKFPILFLLIITSAVSGQPSIKWQKSLGGTAHDNCWSVKGTNDGGSVICARTKSNDGDVSGHHNSATNDYWVVKCDSVGNIEWEKALGGTASDAGSLVTVTKDGGILASGFSWSTDGDINDHHGVDSTSDIWLVKLDMSGNILWSKSYGGSNFDIPASMENTVDSGYLICANTNSLDGDVSGYHHGTNPDDNDIWLLKVDKTGNIEWSKCIGSTETEYSVDAIETYDGGYVVMADVLKGNDGDITGNLDTSANARNIWLAKLDASRNIIWQKFYGGSDIEYANSIVQLNDNGFLLTGTTYSNDGDVSGNHSITDGDVWIVKLDSLGNIEWQKCYGGSYNERGVGFVIDTDGNYVITSHTLSDDGQVTFNNGQIDLWVFKIDTVGNLLWQKSIGGSLAEQAGDLDLTSNGYYITGFSLSNDGDISGHHGLTTTNDVVLARLSTFPTSVSELKNPIKGMEVYPNPATDQVKLQWYLDYSSTILISVFDYSGRQLFSTKEIMSSGLQHFLLEFTNASNGLYTVQITSNGFTASKKINVIR